MVVKLFRDLSGSEVILFNPMACPFQRYAKPPRFNYLADGLLAIFTVDNSSGNGIALH